MMILLNLCTGLPPATPQIRSVRPHRPSHNDGLPRHVCLRVRRPAHRLCRSRRRRALPTTTGCGTTPAGFAPTICAASINSVVTGTSDYIKTFSEAMDTIKTVIWNGPMGVVEFEKFAAVLKFNLYSRSTQIKSGSWTDVRKIEGRTSSGRTRRPRASPSSGLPPRSLVGANGRGGGRESFGAY